MSWIHAPREITDTASVSLMPCWQGASRSCLLQVLYLLILQSITCKVRGHQWVWPPRSPEGVCAHPSHPYLSIQRSTSLMPLSSPTVGLVAAAAAVQAGVSVDLFLYMTSLTAVHGRHSPRAPVAAREATNMCHVLTRETKEHMVRCIPVSYTHLTLPTKRIV